MTQVIQVDPEHPQVEAIERAASVIRGGGLVAFPTETVYGLGADGMSERAVRKIFEAKGRPADNPLILHVGNRDDVSRVADGVSDKAWRLIDRFWPGPLTLVLKRKPEVAPAVSAGLDTVAVRMPDNPIAVELIRKAGTPVAAPSANLSGRPSPTTAEHVLNDLAGRVDMILDGGATDIGIESTVLDMTGERAVILRPGWITRGQIAAIAGQVESAAKEEGLRRSPGTRHRHYSPRARVVLVENDSSQSILQLSKHFLKEGPVAFIGHTRAEIDDESFHCVILENSAEVYAHSIYSALREMDGRGAGVIIVEGITESGEGAAVMDRLRRAASEIL
ncbi:MAG TPA: L-threonylcarbamoyladenylate synthase [Blastocatellia bacterium]|nr:L-threonylcarbamoyladenylate synthase [Blastocatellia bacterium]